MRIIRVVVVIIVILGAVGAVLWLSGVIVERPRYLTVHDAIRAGDVRDVVFHLTHGAELDALDASGYTYLHTAAVCGEVKITRLLLDRGMDPNVRVPGKTLRNYTPLHLAARGNHAQVVTMLLEAGADPGARDVDGLTPLHLAALNNADKAARVLIEKGADVNAIDNNGRTPLDLAVRWRKEEVGRVLVQHGAKRAANMESAPNGPQPLDLLLP